MGIHERFGQEVSDGKQVHVPLIHGAAVLGGVGPRHDDRVPIWDKIFFS